MTTLSIAIDDDLANAIQDLASRLGKNREALIAHVLEEQVSLLKGAVRSGMDLETFEEIRRRLRPFAESAGCTREDRILDDLA
jgi:hypothetical protein